jgi:hypothetical protein
MFIAALFTKANLWKLSIFPTTDKWIKKMWYLYRTKFYLTIKKNEILSFAGKWIEVGKVILSDVTLVQKAKGHMLLSYVEYRPNANTAIL